MKNILLKYSHLAFAMFSVGVMGLISFGIAMGSVNTSSESLPPEAAFIFVIMLGIILWVTVYPLFVYVSGYYSLVSRYNQLVDRVYHAEERLGNLGRNSGRYDERVPSPAWADDDDDIDGDGRGGDTLRRMGVIE